MSKSLFSLLIGGLFSATVSASERKGKMLTRDLKINASSYSYQVYVPAALPVKQKPPIIVFLHGIGQRGAGGFVPTKGIAGTMVQRYLDQVPAIILLPQCRENSYWTNALMDKMVMQLLAETIAEFGADKERLYLTGASMGGYGVWHLASEHPGTFAALVSICGGSPLREGERFAPIARHIGRTPVWVFHGAEDTVVPVSESRQMIAALRSIGGNVRYNEYEGVGHNVWMKALAEPELLPWLLSLNRDKSASM